MSLLLSCSCGARFEVEEAFAGQEVACPECRRPLRAPSPQCAPRRTSGLALASVILAVAGTFTILGTLLAVVLGLLALVSIARRHERLAGIGYAVFGIVWGAVFTGLAVFAYSRGELFGLNNVVRNATLSGQIRYDGPLEVVRRDEGFAITRPTEKWGIAEATPEPILWPDDPTRGVAVTLVHLPTYSLVDVTYDDVGNQSLDQCQERVIGWFSNGPSGRPNGREANLLGFTHFQLRQSRKLKPQDGAEVAELLLDARLAGESRTYLVRLVKRGRELYIVRGWTQRRRFPQMEAEIRRAVESFRLLGW
jgi:hypothetical protein